MWQKGGEEGVAMSSNYNDSGLLTMTPTIQEEMDEEVEQEKELELELAKRNSVLNMKGNDNEYDNMRTRTSFSRLTNSSSSIENHRSNSTITFEKVKITPRPRTQSEQSILSSLSLKSLLDNRINAKVAMNSNEPIQNNATVKRNTRISSSEIDNDSEIGMQLPFTDDKRLGRSEFRSNKSLTTDIFNNQNITPVNETSNVIEDGVNSDEDEDLASQNLTTKALRKLSVLKLANQCYSLPNESPSSSINNAISENDNIPQNDNSIEDDDNQTLKFAQSASNFTTKTELTQSQLQNQQHLNSNNKNTIISNNTIPSQLKNNELGHINTKVNLMTLKDNNIQDANVIQNSKINNLLQNDINNNSNNNNIYSIKYQQQPQRSSLICHKNSNESIRRPNLYNTPMSSSSVATSNTNKPKKQFKQMNNPKKPLYIPAVLRNVSETNLTNEDFEEHNDMDSLIEEDDIVLGEAANDSMSTNASAHDYLSMYSNGGGTMDLDHHLLKNTNKNINNVNLNRIRTTTQSSIHSTASSIYSTYKQKFQDLVNYYGKETPSNGNSGSRLNNNVIEPTRFHWVPDSERSYCHKCNLKFTVLERKHHCRHCGEIFCQKDLPDMIYLNSEAKFCQLRQFGGGVLVKVCHECYLASGKYMQNIKLRKLKKMEEQQLQQQKQQQLQEMVGTENDYIPMRKKNGGRGLERRRESVAGSVPVDWNWSSF